MHQAISKIMFDAVGWLGALLFLISYFLLIIKKWRSTSIAFHTCNILGGVLVGVSALYDRSYPSAFINIAWALIAFYGLYTDQLKENN